jgi:hypothetical protein
MEPFMNGYRDLNLNAVIKPFKLIEPACEKDMEGCAIQETLNQKTLG